MTTHNYVADLERLRQFDKDLVVEGEIAKRTLYRLHIHESNAEKVIKVITGEGGRVHDVTKPSDKCRQVNPDATDEEKESIEKYARHWIFRVYFPPSGSDHVFITSEIVEKVVKYLNEILALDKEGVTRALFHNLPVHHDLVMNHHALQGNVVHGPDGRPMPSVSAWGIIQGLMTVLVGERMGYVTDEDTNDLNKLATGENTVKTFVREIK